MENCHFLSSVAFLRSDEEDAVGMLSCVHMHMLSKRDEKRCTSYSYD